jgi:hypothetical protein
VRWCHTPFRTLLLVEHMKQDCNACGELKPLEQYYNAPGMRDGRRGDCIDCNKAAEARATRAQPERYYPSSCSQWAG